MAPTLESMIRSSLWAGTLPPGELDRVVREAHERKVPVGGHAMRSGDAAGLWVGVIEGLLKMSVSRADGRHSTFTGVTAGGWAGEGTLLKAESHWRYDGIAVRPSRLACVPRHTFERLVSTYIAFNRFLLQHINARLSLFIGLVEFDRLLGPDARVARCLASLLDPDLYPRAGNHVQLSQEEIGLLSAVSRQRANESLHRLERGGLLRVEYGGVTLVNVGGLRGYCDDGNSGNGSNGNGHSSGIGNGHRNGRSSPAAPATAPAREESRGEARGLAAPRIVPV